MSKGGHFERMRDQRRMAQAAEAGTLSLFDRYGRRITVGAEVMWMTPQTTSFIVETISPVMDPRAPAGLIEVRLFLRVGMHVANTHQPMTDLLLVRSQQETGIGVPKVEEPAEPSADGPEDPAGIAPPESGPRVPPLVAEDDAPAIKLTD